MPGDPITRDFFLPPGTPRLTGAYADDRVLVFARDERCLYVSWDLRPATFGEGAAELVVVDLRSRVLAAQPAPSRQGARFPELLPTGELVRAELRRGQRTLARSRWLALPGAGLPVPPPERPRRTRRGRASRTTVGVADARGDAPSIAGAGAAGARDTADRTWPNSAVEWPSSRP